MKENYTEIGQVAQDIVFCKGVKQEGVYYFLLLNGEDIIAWAKVSPTTILNSNYNHLDFVYVVPEHRASQAIKILLYALKEELHALIVDGAICHDGQPLMTKFSANSIFNIEVLNKQTGETEPFTGLVNHAHKCYLLKETGLGYSKQFMPESVMATCWYFPLYD